MTEAPWLCHFCKAPTEWRQTGVVSIGEWGGGVIEKPQYGDVCINPDCRGYLEQVATDPA